MRCKISSEQIKPFMSFGKMPLANGFLEKKDFGSEFTYEMEVGFSDKLSLFQLNETPHPEQMFGKKYPFYTGSSEYMKTHFKKFSDWLKKEFLKSNSKLIEIGSNDGTMLKNFTKTNIDYMGFEPSESVANDALKNNIKTVNDFFTQKNIQNFKDFKKKNRRNMCG